MADNLTRAQRRASMTAIKSQDTLPELAVRRLIHSMGLRYRLHNRNLPGKPDLVFSVRRSVVFVHGCFWHQHKGKKCGARPPKSKQAYWLPKLARTQARDKKNRKTLIAMGWRVLVIWECELRDIESARKRIIEFFKMPKIASSTN